MFKCVSIGLYLDDQNSLCHSVSIHVFGIPDNSLFIRQRLAAICQQHIQQGSPLYKRWILHNRQSENSSKRYNAQVCCGTYLNVDALITTLSLREGLEFPGRSKTLHRCNVSSEYEAMLLRCYSVRRTPLVVSRCGVQ